MRYPRFRWSIRGIMIAVVLVALPLAMPGDTKIVAGFLSITCIGILSAVWMAFRGYRRAAAYSFAVLTAAANISYAAGCIFPSSYLLIPLYFGWVFVVAPTLFILGAAWADIATRATAQPRRNPALAWSFVLILTCLPLVTAVTLWPLHLAFTLWWPAMDRLADQAAAGTPVALPQQAGIYRIARLDLDAGTGNVALVIDTNPNGPTGFIRINPRSPDRSGPPFGPILPTDISIQVGESWWYQVED